jgi:hypothetical protein
MSGETREVEKSKIKKQLLNDGVLIKVPTDDATLKIVREKYERVVHAADGAYTNYVSWRHWGSRLSGASSLSDHVRRCENF